MGPADRTRRAALRHGRRMAIVALTATVVALSGCSDDDADEDAAPTTAETTTTAPIPAPGGQAVEDLDACTLVEEERMASFLDTIGAPPVVSTSADSSEIASVCGWFVEDLDEVDTPERVLLRVEPLQPGANVVCDPPEFTEVEELTLADGEGWATSDDPVETASVVGDWCVYLAAPQDADTAPATTQEATVELLGEIQASLPR